jgi:hypothetical protein
MDKKAAGFLEISRFAPKRQMMADDPFQKAGAEFRKGIIRSEATRDQALEALKDLSQFCLDAIARFYGDPRVDVFVQFNGSNQILIRYGLRPIKFDHMLVGPRASIFVTADGRLMWAKTDRWIQPLSNLGQDIIGVQIELADPRDSLTPLLIEFFQNSETEYAKLAR